jgi:hypothetical protein
MGKVMDIGSPERAGDYLIRDKLCFPASDILIVVSGSKRFVPLPHTNYLQKKQTPWPLARKRTIPTERPPLVGEF